MKNKKAFSLVELSVVILIIALVIGGVLEGGKLILKSRLASAQQLTQNCEIEKMNDLVAWFETSLPESFDNISLEDNTLIASWRDRAVNNATRHNATQTNSTNQPAFVNNAINQALPALQFSGNQWLSFANSDFSNSSYTIFVVEQRNSSNSNLFFISSEGGGNPNLLAGYSSNANMRFTHGSINVNFGVANYNQAQPTTRIHTLIYKNDSEARYFLNGGLSSDAATLSSDMVWGISEILIGASQTNVGQYSGFIAEVIMFKRSLLSEERRVIEAYLGRKYNIAID